MLVKCKRCKRKLKNERSIKMGYGPTCAKKVGIIIPRKRRKKKVEKYVSLEEWE